MPTPLTTINKLRSFSELQCGWHFGVGRTPAQELISTATAFIQFARENGITRTNAFPGIEGQVQVTFYNQELTLEITLERDGSITIAEDRGNDQLFLEERVTSAEAYSRLLKFTEQICDSSESFIANIGTKNVADLAVQPFHPRAATEGYRLLIQNAQSTARSRCAPTLASIILMGTTQFIGKSPMKLSPQTAISSSKKALLEMSATII